MEQHEEEKRNQVNPNVGVFGAHHRSELHNYSAVLVQDLIHNQPVVRDEDLAERKRIAFGSVGLGRIVLLETPEAEFAVLILVLRVDLGKHEELERLKHKVVRNFVSVL